LRNALSAFGADRKRVEATFLPYHADKKIDGQPILCCRLLQCGTKLARGGLSDLLLACRRRRSTRLRIRLGIRERKCTDKEGSGHSVHAIKPLGVDAILSGHCCVQKGNQLSGIGTRLADRPGSTTADASILSVGRRLLTGFIKHSS
jgi:hypothetical protein